MKMPSQKLIDFNIECEVSSKAYYEKHYQHPEWPGGASGVTIGIGYDLGYADLRKLERDWKPLVEAGLIASTAYEAMKECLGVTHEAAHALLPRVRDRIRVSWAAACKVFLENDVPEYLTGLYKAIPEAENLPPDCIGVLFSLAYNRGNGGWKSTGPRYTEMNAIRKHIQSGEWDIVPVEIRRMERLWPGNAGPNAGLRARREKEAALFEAGLKKSDPPAVIAVVPTTPKQQMPNASPTMTEHGTAAGVALAGAEATRQSVEAGWSTGEIMLVLLGVMALAGLLWYAVNKVRTANNPTIARAKDRPDSEPTLNQEATT